MLYEHLQQSFFCFVLLAFYSSDLSLFSQCKTIIFFIYIIFFFGAEPILHKAPKNQPQQMIANMKLSLFFFLKIQMCENKNEQFRWKNKNILLTEYFIWYDYCTGIHWRYKALMLILECLPASIFHHWYQLTWGINWIFVFICFVLFMQLSSLVSALLDSY